MNEMCNFIIQSTGSLNRVAFIENKSAIIFNNETATVSIIKNSREIKIRYDAGLELFILEVFFEEGELIENYGGVLPSSLSETSVAAFNKHLLKN